MFSLVPGSSILVLLAMTSSSNQLSSYSPCSEILKIKVANGTLATIVGQGSISLTPTLLLNYVSVFLSFSESLGYFSNYQKTQLQCNIFLISLCFARQAMGSRLGILKRGKVSTTLKLAYNCSISPFSYHSTRVLIHKAHIWLHYPRLGHPCFSDKNNASFVFKDLDLTSFRVKYVS